ncbi:MAG TPA: CBS domain-containing protein [Candidatus Dormibacteraeota bacterium]
MKVAEIMTRPVITVTPETGIKGAAQLLVQHEISALPVVDAKGELVGIVSEADLLPIETRPDPRSQATPLAPTAGSSPQKVAEVMTRRVLTVPADCEVSQVARILLEADFRRVPVVEDRKVVGIVSRRDLVKVIATRDDTIEAEIVRRLRQLGLGAGLAVGVAAGVATIQLDDQGSNRRLAESVALTVPGVLEVRFANPKGR